MSRFYSLLVFFVLFSFSLSQKNKLINTQKELISKLTGHTKIDDKFILDDRSSSKNRKIAENYLYTELKKISPSPQRHEYSYKKFNGTNVYITIPATNETDQYIILGAHYDSVKDCPGANDNASGVALAYLVGKKISSLEKRKMNVILVFFDQEENGLIGSKAFADKMIKENKNIHSVHTIDQMGWDVDNDLAFELEMPTENLERLYKKVAKKHNVIAHVTDVTSTDHSSFRQRGFNAIGITEEYKNRDTTPHYHKKTDTYNTINFKYLESTTLIVYDVFSELLKLE